MRRLSLVVVAILLLGACGGGGTEEELDAEEYAAEVSLICGDTSADIEEVSGDLNSSDLDEVAASADDAQRIADNGLTDVRDLDRPEGAENAEELIDALTEQAEAYEALAGAAEDRDDTAVDDLRDQLDEVTEEVEDAATRAGIDCEPNDIGPSEQFSDAADASDLTDLSD